MKCRICGGNIPSFWLGILAVLIGLSILNGVMLRFNYSYKMLFLFNVLFLLAVFCLVSIVMHIWIRRICGHCADEYDQQMASLENMERERKVKNYIKKEARP